MEMSSTVVNPEIELAAKLKVGLQELSEGRSYTLDEVREQAKTW